MKGSVYLKKILFGLIALILCFAFFNLFTAKQELQAQERTVAEQTYSDLEKQVLELQQQVFSQGYSYTVKENWVTRLTPAEKQTLCGYIPPKPPAKFISEKISFRPEPNQTKQFKKVALATKYDAMALGLVTPVKNQGSCGSCWIFGAVSDFESDVLIKEGATFDFSEQELGDCNIWARQGGHNFCSGGNSFMTDDYLTKYGGAQETCHPYAAYPQNCLSCPLIKNVNNTRMITGDDGESQSQIEIIKTALLNYGPLQSCMYASGPGFYAYNGGVYEYWGGEEINHAVTIIGWDDTKVHSHGTGAWLIKNSWGTSWAAAGPYPGCAWVAYGSANLGDYTSALAGYQTAGDKIFYHDECGWMGACTGCGSPTAYGAVRFIPESNTSLKAVDFWAVDTNLTYEIKIFDQLHQQGSSYSFSQQIGSTQTGSTNEPGYYSVPLNNPVPLVAGNDFIVQVKFTTTGYGYPLPLDYSNAPWLNWPGIAQFSGESYTSCNGTGYQKPCFAGVGCLDLDIRARAGAGGQPVPLKITTTSLPKAKVGILYGQTLQAEGGTSPYAWSLAAGRLPNGINLNQDGKITGTPEQAGVFNFTVKVKDTLEATDQKNLSLTVEAANPPQPPPVPQLKAPANYSTADSLTPKLEWYAANGATSYGLQVANDYYFSSLVINETGLTETFYLTPAGKLKPNTYYYWRVNATNENGTSNWSIYWRFKTPAGPQPPPVPQLKAPANYSTAGSLAPKLEWYAANGATSYGLQVANDYYFSSLVINETGLTETFYLTPAGKLKPNTYYYWRVNATNENGTSNWSIYWRFKTPAAPSPSIAGWAVIIGVSDYQQINDLSYADDDAQDMYNRLISEGWKNNQIKVLINSQATKTNIKNALDWLKANAQSNDLCLFYFSGHGGHGPDIAPLDEADGQDEYLCPYDSIPNSWANDVRDDELDNWLATLTNKKVIILDTCFSGGFIKTPTLTVKTKPGVSYRQLTDNFTKDIAKAGYETLTASDDHEFSYESSQLQNGVFTYYLEQGLAGGADTNQDNKTSAAETFTYAAPKTAAYTDNQQHPQFFDGIAGEVVVGEK